MNRVVGFIAAAILVGSGCSGGGGMKQLTHDQLLERLRALHGVTVEEATTEQDDLSYYILHFTQPVDHEDPSRGTFQQQVSLLHRSELAPIPMIVHTSGYADYYRDTPVELTRLLGANQVSIEHRYYGTSRPVPTDWSKLSISQMAADEHAIITALRTIYEGAFLSTGGSKGGMTAVFHRRFFPDDVDGTVAYVAPLSFGAPDPRYPGFLDNRVPATCRYAVQALAVKMLQHRSAMEQHAQSQAQSETDKVYTRVTLGAAVEAAVVSLEWTFWQRFGVDYCTTLPDAETVNDDDLFAFLDKISPVSENDDQQLVEYEAYFYQTYDQLGYPQASVPYLVPYLIYRDDDYERQLPTPVEPIYDTVPMRDIDNFVENQGERLLFIYGAWDPWTAGRFALGNAADSNSFLQPQGTHAAQLTRLSYDDREAAFQMIKNWTGVAPMVARLRRAGSALVAPDMDLPEPRMPPVLARALVARR